MVLLGLTAAASATDAAIQKKIFGSGTTTLIFSNEELNDIIKIIKSLKDSGLLIRGVTETVENEVKGLLGMLAATLGASLLGNMSAGKGVLRACEEQLGPCRLLLQLLLKCKNIIETNLNLTAFIQKIIYLK